MTNIMDIKKNIDIEITNSINTYSGEHTDILNINEHEIGNGIYKNLA